MIGKKKCKILREIRQKIADENDIPFVTEECRFKGDCKGTCPRCEAELRYLEQQLEKRRALGKKVTVSALALGMAASLGGCRNIVTNHLEGDVPMSTEMTPLEGDVTAPEETSHGETESTETGLFDPSDNTNVDVYGPPPLEEDPTELEGDVAYEPEETASPAAKEQTETNTTRAAFNPGENVEPNIYGPPQMMESASDNG